jgi:hypothetical protein
MTYLHFFLLISSGLFDGLEPGPEAGIFAERSKYLGGMVWGA